MSKLPTWTPDLASLDLLLSVVELGSVGKAAAAHGMSQPSASARMSRLERRLGVPLLVRGSRGTTLTPAGEAVVAWASAVVDSARALTDGVQSLRETAEVRLRVAASLTVAEYLMPLWLLALRRAHPEVDVLVTVANSHTVLAEVRRGTADIGFVESPRIPSGFGSRRVGSDRLALVASPDFARQLPSGELTPDQLTRLPLLVREPGSGTRETFLQALADALGNEPVLTQAVELGSTATILATARAGGGIGVVSSRAVASEVAAGGLREVVAEGLDAHRPLTAIWLGRHPSNLAVELVQRAQAAVPDHH